MSVRNASDELIHCYGAIGFAIGRVMLGDVGELGFGLEEPTNN
jgi:hypothetical protein